ncbi:hypothetical protein [Chryseobacterium schmidteae]|uniref:hypothetical protein n=1 Tax=Chryseobacterium schmidteae TaxID=2730404 RepID=UPI001E2F9A18|nr:hypothetical protein [Chryseobacterium schmidteae]
MELTEYFQSYEGYFWEWATDEDVSNDSDYQVNNMIYFPTVSSVIGYRVYILTILRELQLQGWPPFGALLLVLYATQDGYKQLRTLIDDLKKNISREQTKELFSEAVFLLKKLEILDHKYKTGQNRVVLIQTLFADNKTCLTSKKSQELYNRYIKIPQLLNESAYKIDLRYEAFRKDIISLAVINRKFPTTESIAKALHGIIEIPAVEE